jgi:hypothetical protein
MSNKNKKKRIDKHVNKKDKAAAETGLLGDNRAKKKYILTGLLISCIAFVLFLILVVPAGTDEKPDDSKQTVASDVNITLLAEPSKVEDKMWNLWFSVSTIVPDSVITFDATIGYILIFDNTTETVVDDDEITSDELANYSFVWAWDIEYESMLSDMTVTVENKTTLKSSGLYISHDEDGLAMFNKEDYFKMKESE